MKLPNIKSTHVVTLLALVIIVMGAVQIVQIRKQTELLQSMISAPRAGGSGQQAEDPYERSVKNQILKYYPDISALYKIHTARNPQVKEGNVVIDFTIDTDGSVMRPQVVSSDFHDAEFENGIIAVIGKIVFPEPIAKRYMTHSFRFKDDAGQQGTKKK